MPDPPDDLNGEWRPLESNPDAMVEFYDPTDVFRGLAEALANSFPAVSTEEGARRRRRGQPTEVDAEIEAESYR